ncbi:PaaI family thioesterase [Desulforhopalus singaporensis]|uniref:Acyl-coenzyme A thioesterase PaaI, contains HGG motif n=1 Tax=Desulforhopalus singaporensis TaxID=91360 RepID=A0A1H0VMN9_9BACT|nr:PaaI family thioesterase [Desulforhopalus singaporensis]SDP79346.1 Acyl-coenzyme A thioesterase PaaI, contains HGG motif [Desulforhopalus singaporensis]
MRRKVERKQPNSKMCFVCGVENSFGLKARFYELDDGQLMAVFQPSREHQGYPGRLHGGIAATILDETIGRAIMVRYAESVWGVTLDFSMKLRKPVPLDKEVVILTRIVAEKKRYFDGEGEIVLEDGTVAVQGRGRYLKMEIDKIADDFDHQGEDWRMVSSPDDPETVEIPTTK